MLAGGLLTGLSAARFVIFNGRIAGISGIPSGLIKPQRADIGWRAACITGLVITPVIYAALFKLPKVQIKADTPALI